MADHRKPERLDLSLAPQPEPRPGPPERQWWRREQETLAADVDDRGIVQISEVLLGQLLLDAGWERTA